MKIIRFLNFFKKEIIFIACISPAIVVSLLNLFHPDLEALQLKNGNFCVLSYLLIGYVELFLIQVGILLFLVAFILFNIVDLIKFWKDF